MIKTALIFLSVVVLIGCRVTDETLRPDRPVAVNRLQFAQEVKRGILRDAKVGYLFLNRT